MDMVDTLRTVGIAAGSNAFRSLESLSDPLDILVGIATFIFLLYKINKEIYDAKERKKWRNS